MLAALRVFEAATQCNNEDRAKNATKQDLYSYLRMLGQKKTGNKKELETRLVLQGLYSQSPRMIICFVLHFARWIEFVKVNPQF